MSGPWCRDVASKRVIFLAPALALAPGLILCTCDWLGGEQCFEKLDFHCLLHSKTSVHACLHICLDEKPSGSLLFSILNVQIPNGVVPFNPTSPGETETS